MCLRSDIRVAKTPGVQNFFSLGVVQIVAAMLPVCFCHAAELRLENQSAPPGASVLASVAFASQATPVSSLQFDLVFDPAVMNVGVTVAAASRSGEKILYLRDVLPNRKRFLLAGLNNSLILDGPLVNLFVNVLPEASGEYSIQFDNVVASDDRGQPVLLSTQNAILSVQPGSAVTALLPDGVLNGASFLPGPVAPGEVITLIGSGIGPPQPLTAESDFSVRFDDVPAPLLFAQSNQINAVVPFALAGKTTAQLTVVSRGQTITALPVPVTTAAPGIFTLDSSGSGSGAVLNEDSTVNSPSNPADRGSIIMLFATGAGQTTPPGVDGQVAEGPGAPPAAPLSVQIGGMDAELLYAGAAPGLVAGILQVNCRIPLEIDPGYTVPFSLRVGETQSPAGVTLAIR